ncbi:hypothetical protein LshimejAT787_0900750 [Lyophyllum shimeji]|uniref:TLC domain-containing protein n=1 Tax=Lyophyllum shimeji TaxID=47721 RepID=A0A9P3PQL1_LYOSH|nr:hypothetical protein LshimejAT787_0900750 [Lyophyllum shimeji]
MFAGLDTMSSLLDVVPTTFLLSFLSLGVSFYVLSPVFATPKQTAWILTAISSAVMSIASLPFLWDYLSSGGSVRHVRTLPAFAVTTNRFFQAYLAADLTFGMMYYRSRISLLEGWIHHTTYIFVVELAIRRSWAHIFCLCGSMEIPTFILGITILYPRLRSNVLFAVSFFMTRISLHVVLAISYLFKDNRTHATGGSYVPSMLLAGIFPLHAMWFTGCIKGFIRRARQKAACQPPPIVELNTIPGAPNASIAARPAKPSVEPAFPPAPLSRLHRIRLSAYHRRQHLKKAFRSLRTLRFDFLDSPLTKRVLPSGSITAYFPRRETVFDYVGLGRTMTPQPMEDFTARVASRSPSAH